MSPISRLVRFAAPGILGLLGLVAAHHSMLFTALGDIQGNPGDPRFVNFMLEHSYLWLAGAPLHASFWDPPFFYPQPNTAAYSEIFLGAAPAYWMWRAMGCAMDTAYQLWILLISGLNYCTAYFFIRRGLKVTSGPAALGAYLFAFGASRINQISHPQLLPHFFSLLAIWAMIYFLDSGRKRPSAWILPLFLGALTAQIYASFYLGWFLILGLGAVSTLAILIPKWRKTCLEAVSAPRLLPFPLILSVGLLAMIGILAAQYLQAADTVGTRQLNEVSLMVPRLSSWLFLGSGSWLYGSLADLQWFSHLPMKWEHRLGMGLLTTTMVMYGFWCNRKRPIAQVVALISVIFLVVSLHGPAGFSLWRFVYEYVPGGGAIRAVSRIGIVALIPASIGIALAMDRIRKKHARVALVLAAVCMLEQGISTPSFSKEENRRTIADLTARIAQAEPCESFFYTRITGDRAQLEYQLDAMWASLASGTPTVNGYSGNLAPNWNLFEINLQSDLDDQTIRQELANWSSRNGLAAERVCFIQSGQRGPDDAIFTAQDVRPRMTAGDTSKVSLVVKNTGVSTWTRAKGYRLGSQAPQDNSNWGAGRVELPASPIRPGESAVFQFDVIPSNQAALGTNPSLKFRWRMVRDGVHWFGTYSEPVSVEVLPERIP